jgi:nicotinamidase-related amidase
MAEHKYPPTYEARIGPAKNQWRVHAVEHRRFNLVRKERDRGDKDIKIVVSTGAQIVVEPSQCALVIIDMQNYFLSSALGRERGAGHEAAEQLAQYAIPAARKVGMQILWVNWGLEEKDMKTMPAAVTRCFGIAAKAIVFDPAIDGESKVFVARDPVVLDRHANLRQDRTYAGLGAEIGKVIVPESEVGPSKIVGETDAGRLLFRDTWNAEIYGPLAEHYMYDLEDELFHKNRMSGLWSNTTPLAKHLKAKSITTLFFAGINTDQCVGSTLTDAFSLGYDCILLSDGCGTSSPPFAQQAWEYNCENTFGFVTKCSDLQEATKSWHGW